MDMQLFEMLSRANPVQQGSMRDIAQALAAQQMQEERQAALRDAHMEEITRRRLQELAVNDPALARLRQQLEAPVPQYAVEAPQSYAPGAARDVGSLAGAFAGGAPAGPPAREDPRARVALEIGDVSLGPAGAGAFEAPSRTPEIVALSPREEPKRKPLPAKPKRLEGGLNILGQRGGPIEETRRDLSPAGAELYAKLIPELVKRRNTEEVSRRSAEVEQQRQRGGERKAQLRSATELLKTSLEWSNRAQVARERARSAKGRDEQLKWLDQQRDATLQAMNAAQRRVEYMKTQFVDENDPDFIEAKHDAVTKAQAYVQATDEFQQAMSNKGLRAKPSATQPAPKGKTQSYKLDANGQLIPG